MADRATLIERLRAVAAAYDTHDTDAALLEEAATALASAAQDMRGVAYVIWSNEHRAWWNPKSCGYTGYLGQAGRYSKAEAEAICRDGGRARAWSSGAGPYEEMLIAPECTLPAAPAPESTAIAKATALKVYPMETAPKTGLEILICGECRTFEEGLFQPEGWNIGWWIDDRWCTRDGEVEDPKVWAPLPSMPLSDDPAPESAP